jgi:hypothetical protein
VKKSRLVVAKQLFAEYSDLMKNPDSGLISLWRVEKTSVDQEKADDNSITSIQG